MNLEDLQISNYQEAMKSSQKSLYVGVFVSVFTYFIGSGAINGTSIIIPLLRIELTSNVLAIYTLAALYFYSGLHCNFAVSRAVKSYNSIENRELANTLLYFPCLVNSNNFYQTAIAGILYGIWYLIFTKVGIFDSLWQSAILVAVVISPYMSVLNAGRYLAPKG